MTIHPVPRFPRELDGDYEVFFADARYTVHLYGNPWPEDEDFSHTWGLTEHTLREITVRTEEDGARLAADHVQDVLMHELIHAAMYVSGYHPLEDAFTNESIASVLARPMLQLFGDERNLPIIRLLLPPRHIMLPMPDPDNMPSTEEWDRAVMQGRLWSIPEKVELGRVVPERPRSLKAYVEALHQMARNLAAEVGVPVSAICPDAPDSSSDYADHAARLILSDEEPGGEASPEDTQRIDLCSVYGASSGLYCDKLRGHDELDKPPAGREHNFTRPDPQSGRPARCRDIPDVNDGL